MDLNDICRRIHPRPAEEFGLISREEIGLRVGADKLHASGGAVEVVVAVLYGAIALGAGGFDFSAPAPVVGIGEGASHCVVQALEVEVVVTAADCCAAAILDLAPAVTDGADSAVEAIERVVSRNQTRLEQ